MSGEEIYNIFSQFMNMYDLYPRTIEEFPSYTVDRCGTVRDINGNIVKPYHYENQYDSVYLKEDGKYGKRDVHRLVAKTFNSGYFEGCVVHHINENKFDNRCENLECLTKEEHASKHFNEENMHSFNKGDIPWNKGKIMSEEYYQKAKMSAKMRHERGDYSHINGTFHGNQYVDEDMNKK